MLETKDQEFNETQIENMQIDGKQVVIEQQPGKPVTVHLPEGLDEATEAEYRKQVETGSKLVGQWYRKNQIANEREAELNRREQELKEREAKLSAPPKPEEPKPEEITPIWKRLGLASEAEEDDYASENPAAYRKAEREYLRDEARAEARKELLTLDKKSQQTMQEQLLVGRIKAAGADPNEVIAFAKFHGMPLTDNAFDLYTQVHSKKSDPVIAAQLEAQKHQVKYITPGTRIKEIASIPVKEMTDEEIDLTISQAKKAAAGTI